MGRRIGLPLLLIIVAAVACIIAWMLFDQLGRDSSGSDSMQQASEHSRVEQLGSDDGAKPYVKGESQILRQEEEESPESSAAEVKHGQVVISNIDELNNLPIIGATYHVEHANTQELLGVIRTDEEGKAVTDLLVHGTDIVIRQIEAPFPYSLNLETHELTIADDEHQVKFANKQQDYVKEFEILGDGTIKITHLELPMESVLQNPELPNGCEITSLTAVLNIYGYDVSKLEMADDYLIQEPYARRDGKLYGANPYKAYAGNPRHERGAFFVYAPPIVTAAETYIADVGGNHQAFDISGSSREEIIEYLDRGIPIVIWVTLNLEKSRLNYSWYFHETGEFFRAPVNLHCVVLHGYDGDQVYVMDPLRGLIMRDADEFFLSYEDLGSHAMIVTESAPEQDDVNL